MNEITKSVLDEVLAERVKQDAKWGQQDHLPIEYCAILGEEVGEVNKAALEAHFGYPYGEEKAGSTAAKMLHFMDYRMELIQVAAVAISMVESYDRNEDLFISK